MASSTIIPSAITQPDLSFIGSDGKPVTFQIVGFAVDGNSVKPLTWPAVPSKAETYVRTSSGFQRFDIESGLSAGPYFTSLSGVSK